MCLLLLLLRGVLITSLVILLVLSVFLSSVPTEGDAVVFTFQLWKREASLPLAPSPVTILPKDGLKHL